MPNAADYLGFIGLPSSNNYTVPLLAFPMRIHVGITTRRIIINARKTAGIQDHY
jgi:hypothetical protein